MRLLTAVVGVIFPADEEATLPIVASAALITPGSALRMSPLLRLNPTLNRPHGKLGREGHCVKARLGPIAEMGQHAVLPLMWRP